jgi:hypothetical protein
MSQITTRVNVNYVDVAPRDAQRLMMLPPTITTTTSTYRRQESVSYHRRLSNLVWFILTALVMGGSVHSSPLLLLLDV